jgi:hypothetical protein
LKESTSRRSFIKTVAVGAAVGLVGDRQVRAATPQKLDVNDPAAKALGYVEDAGTVDTKKYPGYVKGSNCENCLLLEGSAGAHFRPCTAFGGKLVSASGWCTSWAAEM